MISNDLIIENLQSAIFVVDTKALVQQVNLSCEILFDKSRRAMQGKSLFEFIDEHAIKHHFNLCYQKGSQFTLREITINNGKSLVDITLSRIASTNKLSSNILIEINSINRISRFIQEENQLERQQAFRLMMRSLAHEIKNPLSGLRGAAQLLNEELTKPSHLELSAILIKETDRLSHLVDRVMGLRQQLRLGHLNIHEVLEHIIELICVTTDGNTTSPIIKREYDPALPEIDGDKEQLIQAVLNIAKNAIQAQREENTTSGATPATIGFITSFERLITLQHKLYRKVLKIKIWDAGPGVSDDIKEHLFDPLVTNRPSGTGLGLSISQEIVQRHNGLIQLEQYKGNTCFSIYLPYLENNL